MDACLSVCVQYSTVVGGGEISRGFGHGDGLLAGCDVT
jgi:hypothetical protein